MTPSYAPRFLGYDDPTDAPTPGEQIILAFITYATFWTVLCALFAAAIIASEHV